jgi:hypothetical protein
LLLSSQPECNALSISGDKSSLPLAQSLQRDMNAFSRQKAKAVDNASAAVAVGMTTVTLR